MSLHLVRQLVAVTVSIAAGIALSGQCRKPTWWTGRLFLSIMNARHSRLTDWGLSHVSLERHFTMLDVGCGGGKTISKLAAAANAGKVYGIDYSAASVAVARHTNRQRIQTGQVDIRLGSVSQLPFPDSTFEIVTAVETHYYWPNPVEDLREILRVLKPGGRLVVIAEAYRSRPSDVLVQPVMKLLRARYWSVAEHRELFSSAGYAEIEIVEERSRGWICAIGTKPST